MYNGGTNSFTQDHLITMTQNLNHYEKILSRSHSNYLAQISIEMTDANNQINDVLSKLTALGTILIPMNLVTGSYIFFTRGHYLTLCSRRLVGHERPCTRSRCRRQYISVSVKSWLISSSSRALPGSSPLLLGSPCLPSLAGTRLTGSWFDGHNYWVEDEIGF